jgi:hypothetical protein
VTWGSTTFYSSNSSNSPAKRRRSQSSRRSSFKTFDGAYDSDSDNDDYETDDSYYDIGKASTPTKKKSEERKVKVTLKNQHLFDDEGHASVPLLAPKDSQKLRAYREIYADQLGAWGLYIQHAEILKFNGLIEYWPVDTPVYPLQGQLSGQHFSEATAAHSQTLPRHRGSSLFDSTSSKPTPTGGFVDTRTSPFLVDNVSGLPLPPPGSVAIIDYSLPTPELGRLASGTEANAKMKPDDGIPSSRNCHICLERIQGLFVNCPRGEHKAHATCYEEYISGRNEEDVHGRGVSCGCKPYESEDWKSDLETSWGSVMVGKGRKLNALPFAIPGTHDFFHDLYDAGSKKNGERVQDIV